MKRAGLGEFVVAIGLSAAAVAACVGNDPSFSPPGTSTSGDGGASSSSGGSATDGGSHVQQDGAATDAAGPPIEHCVEGKSECTQFEETGGASPPYDHASASNGCSYDISTAQSKSATHSARLFCQGPVTDTPAQGTMMFAPEPNGHDSLHIEFDFFAKALPPVATDLFVLSSVPRSLTREESFIISADSTGWKIRNDLDSPPSPNALGTQPNLGEWNHAVIDIRFATASAGGSFEMTLDGRPAASVNGAKTASGAPDLDMAIEFGPYIREPITAATLFEVFLDNVEVDVR